MYLGHRTFSELIVRITIGALALAISAIILSIAILNGFKSEIIEKQRGFFGDITITKNDLNSSYENTPIQLYKEQLEDIKKHPQIRSITPFATKAGIMNVNGEVEGVLLKGIDDTYEQKFFQRNIVQGDTIDFGNSPNTQLLISDLIAKRLKLKVGDKMIMYFVQEPLRKRPFTVKGIFATHTEELDKTYVIGSLDLIRRLNNLSESEVGAYQLHITSFDSLASVTEQVNDLLPLELNATSIVEQMPDIFNWLKMLDMNDSVIFALMVIVAVINMVSSLLISILERVSMIGILKALGYPNSGIRRVFLYGSLYMVGLGLLIGNAVALMLYLFQRSTHFFSLDPAIYYIEYVPMFITWYEVLGLNIALVGIGMLTLFLPAMLVSKISPIKTIQFK